MVITVVDIGAHIGKLLHEGSNVSGGTGYRVGVGDVSRGSSFK